jgi:hypothetical protein
VLVLLLWPALARPEAVPVRWSGLGASGDVGPLQPTAVELVSARLRIDLKPDGDSYQASAIYELENGTGEPETVACGVPLFGIDGRPAVPDDGRPAAEPAPVPGEPARPGGVQLALNGRPVSCSVDGVRPVAQAPEAVAAGRAGWPWLEGRCLASLEVPPGRSILTLRYPGSLAFVDSQDPGEPFLSREVRVLEYQVAPAAAWAGPPRLLEVTLVAGEWADWVTFNAPAGWRRAGNRYLLKVKAPDFRQLTSIGALVRSNAVLSLRERMTQPLRGSWSATAGDAGKEGRKAPELIDGDPATAWCVPAGGAGWVELSGEARGTCSLRLVLVAGTPASPAASGPLAREAALAIGPCGAPPASKVRVAPLAGFDDLDARWDGISVRRGSDAEGWTTRSCVRVAVENAAEGGTGPACLAELRPVASCR